MPASGRELTPRRRAAQNRTMLVHATSVLVEGAGVLIRGAPGSGKSDLALRLIDAGASLVADDRTEIAREDGALVARAPEPIAGLLEVRGLGIVKVRSAPEARLALVVDLVGPQEVERMPEPCFADLLGIKLPLIRLAPFQAAAAAKLRLAVVSLGRERAIIPPP